MIRRLLKSVLLLLCLGVVACGGLALLWPSDSADQVALAQEILDLDAFQQLVREIVLDSLKPEYTSQHKWGQQATVSHHKLGGKWFAPKLKTTTSTVNDGLWQRFVVTLVEPGQNLSTRVESVRQLPDGRLSFTFFVEARVSGRGQFERWDKGVRLFDVSGDADATVAAQVECAVAVRREPAAVVDDVVLDPQVTAIRLQLVDFDLRRVGRVGHDVSRELGAALRPTIEHELEKREPRMADKVNASIDKRRDRLRFSLEKFLASGWAKFSTALAGNAPAQRN